MTAQMFSQMDNITVTDKDNFTNPEPTETTLSSAPTITLMNKATNATTNSSDILTMEPSYDFTFKLLKEPPIISKEEQNRSQEILEFIDPNPQALNQSEDPVLGPDAAGPKLGPELSIENQSVSNNEQLIKRASLQFVDDRDFRSINRLVSLPQGSATPLNVNPLAEPAVANNGQTKDGKQIVFYVGNSFAARSETGGRDWRYYDYNQDGFPNIGDNDVIYSVAAGGKFIWYRQGEDGRFSLGISSDAQQWTFYEMFAKSISRVVNALTDTQRSTLQAQGSSRYPLNPWFDRPQLELTNRHLFIATRVFLECNNSQSPNDPNICNTLGVRGLLPRGLCTGRDPSTGLPVNACNQYVGSIIFRINLGQISQVVPGRSRPTIPVFDFLDRSGHFGLVQGATDTMYWATHINNAKLKIYSLDDTAVNIQVHTRDIRPFIVRGSNQWDCSLNNIPNTNWCGEASSIITTGWVRNNRVGFFWNVPQGCLPRTVQDCYQNHRCTPKVAEVCAAWPYVDGATFDIRNGLRYVARPSLYNSNFAVMYAYASPTASGLGIMCWIGGGNMYPTLTSSVDDNYQRYYNAHILYSGADTGGQTRWGDYLRLRPFAGAVDSGIWIASGYVYSSSTTIDIVYFIFGREINTRTIQNLDMKESPLLPNLTINSISSERTAKSTILAHPS
jgi:hypothetical protein